MLSHKNLTNGGRRIPVLEPDFFRGSRLRPVRFTMALALLGMLVCNATGVAAESPQAAQRLKELDAKIAATPGDAKLHFERARCLITLGRYDDGYQSAQKGREVLGDQAMFLKAAPLEDIELETIQVEVQFNLGQNARTSPSIGIARPLTFRVWVRGDVRELIDTIDFELGYLDGRPNTAALGQQEGEVHMNLGTLDPKSSYAAIRDKAIELIKERAAGKPVRPRSGKKYVNISLPGRSKFTPIILSATPEKIVFARVAEVDGKRDIQVQQGLGDRWEFVGERGRALTGEDGSFLSDAVEGCDGRLWVLTSYTSPSNPKIGDRAFLYCYESGRWHLADSHDGHPASSLDRGGLVFLGDPQPVHVQAFFGETPNAPARQSVLQWRNEQWQVHPAEKIMQESGGQLVWNAREAWLIAKSQAEGKTLLRGYHIVGPRAADTTGPYSLLTLDGSYDLYLADACDDHRLALLFKEAGMPNQSDSDKPYAGWIVDVNRPDKPVVESITTPPANWVEHLRWSPKRELVATECNPSKVQVFALRNAKWTAIAEASQDISEGYVFSPRLVFRTDGVPIMTWENFFPR